MCVPASVLLWRSSRAGGDCRAAVGSTLSALCLHHDQSVPGLVVRKIPAETGGRGQMRKGRVMAGRRDPSVFAPTAGPRQPEGLGVGRRGTARTEGRRDQPTNVLVESRPTVVVSPIGRIRPIVRGDRQGRRMQSTGLGLGPRPEPLAARIAQSKGNVRIGPARPMLAAGRRGRAQIPWTAPTIVAVRRRREDASTPRGIVAPMSPDREARGMLVPVVPTHRGRLSIWVTVRASMGVPPRAAPDRIRERAAVRPAPAPVAERVPIRASIGFRPTRCRQATPG